MLRTAFGISPRGLIASRASGQVSGRWLATSASTATKTTPAASAVSNSVRDLWKSSVNDFPYHDALVSHKEIVRFTYEELEVMTAF